MSHHHLTASGLEVAFGHRRVLCGVDLETLYRRRLALRR